MNLIKLSLFHSKLNWSYIFISIITLILFTDCYASSEEKQLKILYQDLLQDEKQLQVSFTEIINSLQKQQQLVVQQKKLSVEQEQILFTKLNKILSTSKQSVSSSMSGIPNASFSKNDFLIDADGLAEQLESDKPPVVLEVRYHPHRYFTVGHIPGAIQVQRFKDLGDNLASSIMRFPSHEVFQQRLRSWGINNGSNIVIYDDSSTALASRLYFSLQLYGYDMSKVRVLNGGTINWTVFNELTKEATATPKTGNVTLKPTNPDMLVEWTKVYDDMVSRRDEKVVLIDMRPTDMYTGKIIKHAVQAGHIPGAINIVSLLGTDGQSQTWHSKEEIAAMYAEVPKDKTLYLYCHDGFRMSLGFMQLKLLGYKDIRLLNGGWTIWDKAMTLPIVKGDKPYDEAYEL